MRNLGSRAKGLGLATALALVAVLVVWHSRTAWTDHDVSDPGVTL
jgi:hypothetical protein